MVSVVMCTYNGEKFLRGQLDTLLAQTVMPHEIIVQDDCSQDSTWEILQEYAASHAVMKVYRNERPMGINENFFSALGRASGDFIAICDQDDLWNCRKIELQLQAIGDKMMCGCHSQPFSEDGAFAWYDARKPNINIIRMLFASLPGHTLLIRRELLSLLPDKSNAVYGVAMYDSILDMIAASYDSIAYVDAPLVRQRRHAAAATYTAYGRSLPTASNAFYIFAWSLWHYNAIKPYIKKVMRCRLELLDTLDPQSTLFMEAKKIARAEIDEGAAAYMKLTCLFVRNRKHLFHTCGGGLLKWLRALSYPVMQMWNYRLWLRK